MYVGSPRNGRSCDMDLTLMKLSGELRLWRIAWARCADECDGLWSGQFCFPLGEMDHSCQAPKIYSIYSLGLILGSKETVLGAQMEVRQPMGPQMGIWGAARGAHAPDWNV